jgi:hypothetical protein
MFGLFKRCSYFYHHSVFFYYFVLKIWAKGRKITLENCISFIHFFSRYVLGGTLYLEGNGRGLDPIQFNSNEFIDPIGLLLPTCRVIEKNIYISFSKHLFLKFIFHVNLCLLFFFFPRFHRHLDWFSSFLLSLIFFRCLSIPTFRCTVRFLLRSQLSFP